MGEVRACGRCGPLLATWVDMKEFHAQWISLRESLDIGDDATVAKYLFDFWIAHNTDIIVQTEPPAPDTIQEPDEEPMAYIEESQDDGDEDDQPVGVEAFLEEVIHQYETQAPVTHVQSTVSSLKPHKVYHVIGGARAETNTTTQSNTTHGAIAIPERPHVAPEITQDFQQVQVTTPSGGRQNLVLALRPDGRGRELIYPPREPDIAVHVIGSSSHSAPPVSTPDESEEGEVNVRVKGAAHVVKTVRTKSEAAAGDPKSQSTPAVTKKQTLDVQVTKGVSTSPQKSPRCGLIKQEVDSEPDVQEVTPLSDVEDQPQPETSALKQEVEADVTADNENHAHTCESCGEWFPTTRRLSLHQKKGCKPEKPTEIRKPPLKRKKDQITEDEPFEEAPRKRRGSSVSVQTCSICGAHFTSPGAFKVHKASHGDNPYKCSICKKRFAAIKEFTEHMRVKHNDPKPFKCADCDVAYRRPGTLAEHRIHKHSSITNVYKCPHCDLCFGLSRHRLDHMRTDHIDLLDEEELAGTPKVREGDAAAEGPSTCTLDKPKMISAGEGTIKRKVGRPRKIKPAIKEEEDDQEPFCTVCLMSFSSEEEVAEHAPAHRDEPFLCNKCDKSFRTGGDYSLHMRAKHDVKCGFKCTLCHESFYRMNRLRNHMSQVHPSYLGDASDEEPKTGEDKDVSLCPFTLSMEDFPEELDESTSTKENQEENEEFEDGIDEEESSPVKTEDTTQGFAQPWHRSKPVNFCPVCCQHFENKPELLEHKQTHGTNPFHCGICKERFPTSYYYKEHMRAEHDVKHPFQCGDCGKKYTTSGGLAIHRMNMHTGEMLFACSLCDEKFPSSGRRRLHEVKVHGAPKQPLKYKKKTKPKLEQSGKTSVPTIRHINVLFMCSVCGKNFPNDEMLQEHKGIHGEMPFSCSVCDERFRSAPIYQRHMQEEHDVDRPFKCGDCNRVYRRVNHLAEHIRIKHTKQAIYKCSLCDETFLRASHRRTHEVKVHPEVPAVQCPHCSERFPNNSKLQTHITYVHTDTPGFMCDICGKSFVTKGNLGLHMDSHNYKTTQCPICFGFYRNLQKHMSRHTDERPHVCHICGKGFKAKAGLKYHVNKHSAPTRWLCEPCGLEFRTRKELFKHKAEHPGIKHKCEECGKVCYNHFALAQHRREHLPTILTINSLG